MEKGKEKNLDMLLVKYEMYQFKTKLLYDYGLTMEEVNEMFTELFQIKPKRKVNRGKQRAS